VFVLVEDSTESISSVDVEMVQPGRIGDRFRSWAQRGGAVQGSVRAVGDQAWR
jgi:hypothetical protein